MNTAADYGRGVGSGCFEVSGNQLGRIHSGIAVDKQQQRIFCRCGSAVEQSRLAKVVRKSSKAAMWQTVDGFGLGDCFRVARAIVDDAYFIVIAER